MSGFSGTLNGEYNGNKWEDNFDDFTNVHSLIGRMHRWR